MLAFLTETRSRAIYFACAIIGIGFLSPERACAQQEPALEELARGPIHEAFGQPVTFNPEPGVILDKKPPDPVEEMPPDQKPEGENVVWIPGYWSATGERFQLVPALLAAEFPGSEQVIAAGLATADDRAVWGYAAARGLAIVS